VYNNYRLKRPTRGFCATGNKFKSLLFLWLYGFIKLFTIYFVGADDNEVFTACIGNMLIIGVIAKLNTNVIN